MTKEPSERNPSILVELKPRNDLHGTTDVSLTPSNIAEKSTEAINKAMSTIKSVSGKVVEAITEIQLSERPDDIEVEFGLKLTTDANALIVNAGAEAHFVVKLKWTRNAHTTTKDEGNQ